MRNARKPTQYCFDFRGRGGSRRGAGRPRKLIGDPLHARRPRIDLKTPAHVTIKLLPGLPSLRTPAFIRAMTKAIKCAKIKGLGVLQFAIESNHAHFIIEAEDNDVLARGVSSLKISMVWALRTIFRHYGRVFNGRYHLETLSSPTQVRNAIKYVLFNHAKHCGIAVFGDLYSSVFAFDGVEDLIGHPLREAGPVWQTEINEAVSTARSWLARNGWRRAR